jgi:hypothetical protein
MDVTLHQPETLIYATTYPVAANGRRSTQSIAKSHETPSCSLWTYVYCTDRPVVSSAFASLWSDRDGDVENSPYVITLVGLHRVNVLCHS